MCDTTPAAHMAPTGSPSFSNLNLGVPPFIPQSTRPLPHIPENISNVKSKKKSSIPVSPKQEQTKIEQGLVRTKLKQTETDLKTTKEMNDILMARHKLFEDKRLNDAVDKLFKPNQETNTSSTSSFQAPVKTPLSPTPSPPVPSSSPPVPSSTGHTIESLIQL